MNLKIEYLGWAAFLLTTPKGLRVLTDPFLAGDVALQIPKSPVDAKDLVVDLILASHCATDHFAQAMEVMGNSDKTKILGDHSTMIMTELGGFGGLNGPRAELITSGATYPIADLKIKAVDARHIAFAHLPDGRFLTGEPLCYLIQVENGPTIFFGGDTSITMDMKLWGEQYRPDIAIIGIGGVNLDCDSCGGRSLDEMDPEDAALCAEMLGAKKVIPMHYRGEAYLERFKKALAVRAPSCELVAMEPGSSIEL